jgi:hypothetical protein
MVDSRWLANRVAEYQQLSSWEKQVLQGWIEHEIDSGVLWSYTSLGICTLFRDSEFGFRITHAQMQHAMLVAGYKPVEADEDIWVFRSANTDCDIEAD